MFNRFTGACHRIKRFSFEVESTNPPRIIYVGGWMGHANLGDEALFEAYKRLFHKYNFIRYPQSSRLLMMICKLLRPAHVSMLAGGTLINRGEYFEIMQHCSKICSSSFVFGTGVADPYFWNRQRDWYDTLREWKPILDRCSYVGVRGPRSLEILKDIGVNAEVIGDPVIALCGDEPVQEEKVFPKSVGFNIGQSRGRLWGDEDSIQREFTRLGKLAKNAGWKVRWFIVWKEDREITLRTARDSGTEAEVFELYSNPDVYLDLVRPLSVFVGMKLHSAILATCAFVPSIMLEYQPKCRDYMRSIEQEKYSVRTDCFKAEYVWDLICFLHEERFRLSRILREKIMFLRDKQIKKAAELMLMFANSK